MGWFAKLRSRRSSRKAVLRSAEDLFSDLTSEVRNLHDQRRRWVSEALAEVFDLLKQSTSAHEQATGLIADLTGMTALRIANAMALVDTRWIADQIFDDSGVFRTIFDTDPYYHTRDSDGWNSSTGREVLSVLGRDADLQIRQRSRDQDWNYWRRIHSTLLLDPSLPRRGIRVPSAAEAELDALNDRMRRIAARIRESRKTWEDEIQIAG